ncbi:BTB/POZ domain-containing protein [Apostasia shenzhenica]|uniref:BTB/POZ domain-containing protein n=1 Tax=Apostasia shenzhenica TaxID=1088818 RepID=A0A2I0B2G8_9ASPA|nr:BTB/POZ domain-containing protein [Apostasia shenzhenica]
MTASNVVYLRCAAEYLQMTEEVAEGNLISQSETFLNQTVLRSWKDSMKALQTCDDLLPYADDLNIVKRCIESLAVKVSTDPNLFGWPIEHGAMQSPGGSDWWYEDVSSLSLPLYKKLISSMESRGVGEEIIAGSLVSYARRFIPGLNKNTSPSDEEQRNLLEEIERLLPFQKGVATTKFLCSLLRTGLILKVNPVCLLNLERRIGMQLDQATLDDLLMPTFSYSMETLYDVDCVQRILEHFLATDQGSPSLAPSISVAKLIDGYLAEVASDLNLKLSKFHTLAAAVPEYTRPLYDGLYRAIDIYLKSHPWLTEAEREELCRVMDCQKLSLEACTHAAQNERLPLRVIVQVLFFEQLQLRTSIAGCFLVSDNLEGSRQLRSGLMVPNEGGGWATAARENQVLKVGMDHMRIRVSELEKECSTMRKEIEKLGLERSVWSKVPRKFGIKLKSQMCSTQEDTVSEHHRSSSEKMERIQTQISKHKRNKSLDD